MDRSRVAAALAALPIVVSVSLTTAFASGALAQDAEHNPSTYTQGGSQLYFGRDARQLLAQQYDLNIPPLAERPAVEGPRIRVIEFNIVGLTERPDRGVTAAGINEVLTRNFATQPIEGWTMFELQDVAQDVTNYYRQRGMMVAQAFIPAQDVREGLVTMQIVEGSLGAVTVDGNRSYEIDSLLGPFETLIQQPIYQADVEEALLTLQDYPGLTVFGTFRRGQALGDTELLVSVRDEDRFYVRPGIDNYGSEFTGDQRGTVQFGVNNITGGGDSLTGYVLKTASPSNGSYYGLQYEAQTKSAKNAFGVGLTENTFDVVPTGIRTGLLQGTVEQGNFFYERRFANRRRFRADGTLDIARKDAEIVDLSGARSGALSRDELTTLSYMFDYYSVAPRQRGINLGYFRVTGGDNSGPTPGRRTSANTAVESGYSKFDFMYQRLQRVGENHALLFRFGGQKSSDLLVPLEQYPIGGPTNVRAYAVAEALVDTGAAATVEWIIDAPGFANRPIGSRTWGDVFQLSFFYDYGGGEINDPLVGQTEKHTLRGHGIGLQFSVSEKFYLRIDGATPDTSRTPSNGKDPQWYASFNYTF
jgi:hemolysin activation/secretion protein